MVVIHDDGRLQEAKEKYVKVITKFQQEAIAEVAKSQNISQEQARELLMDDEQFQQLMNTKDKEIRIHLFDTMYPKFIQAAEDKMNKGSLEQAKHAITAAGIIKDF